MWYKLDNIKFRKISKSTLSNLNLVKDGNCGKNGSVFRYSDDKCIKIFSEPMSIGETIKIGQLSKYSFDYASMPEEIVLLNCKPIGYLMNYINGDNLSKNYKLKFDDFLELSSDLILNAFELSYIGLFITDSHSKNIILSDDKLVLVDTDSWMIDYDIDTVRKNNFLNLDRTFCKLMFGIEYSGIDYYDIKKKKDYIDYYYKYKKNFEKNSKIKVKYINDINLRK